MISTARLVKIWCGRMLIRIVNKFSLSLSPSTSDSPGNTPKRNSNTSELVDANSSAYSERNTDDKWQVRRTGVHPILMRGRTCKMCTDIFFTVSFVFVAGFVYSR